QVSSTGTKLVPESLSLTASVHLQLKATSTRPKLKPHPDLDGAQEAYPFSLPIKNYDDLRGHFQVPRLLVVFFLPPRQAHWLKHTEGELITRRCAYWCSLRDLPEVPDQESKTVYLPKVNVLNCESLRDLLTQISIGKLL